MQFTNTTNQALVHSIETFGTVDGPGIRYVLFLQGCNLKCQYCHNKDACNFNSGILKDAEEIITHIKRYKDYILMSKGGITVSGGEPLLQAKFVAHFFKRLKEYNFHTALDTSGSLVINDDIKRVLQYTDLVLLDIKHINNEKCKMLTGQSNDNTLAFAKYLNAQNIPVWIRQVLVPGITDNEQDLKMLKSFLSSMSNVEKVEILPYHTMGKYKWENLGLDYPLENIPPATVEDVNRAKSILGMQ